MQFQQDMQDYPIHIKSYNNAELTIMNRITGSLLHFDHSVLVSFDQIIDHWQPHSLAELSVEHIKNIISMKPEIVVLGIGEKLLQVDYKILEPFYSHKIPFEIMTTTNACRTYNILASEHRQVVVGLIVN